MSPVHPARALAAATAAAAFAVAAAPAHAAERTFALTCEFPLVGSLPIELELGASYAAVSPHGESVIQLASVLTGGTNEATATSTWRAMKILRAERFSGLASLDIQVQGRGVDLATLSELVIAEHGIPASERDVIFPAVGFTPPLRYTQPGPIDLTVNQVQLNLIALKADGTPVRGLPPVAPEGDSDGDPDTFDVPCAIDAGQDRKIILADREPTPPGRPSLDLDTGRVTWAPATDDVGIVGYDVFVDGQKVRSVDGTTTSALIPEFFSGTHELTVQARDAGANVSKSPATSFTVAVNRPPTTPGKPVLDSGSFTLRWAAATDDEGIVGYDVLVGGQKVGSTDGATTSLNVYSAISGYGNYTFVVKARDADGNESESPSATVNITPGSFPPSTPGAPRASEVTASSATLTWRPSIAPVGALVDHYEVLRDGTVVAESESAAVQLKGLAAGTEYCVTVVAVSTEGGRSNPTEPVCFTTLPSGGQEIPYGYDLTGAATLKTLTKGTLPLRGSIAAKLQVNTGAVSADLALAPTKARLTTLGFLPVTASVAFVTNGKTTGTLTDAGLKTRSSVRIKLPQVTLLGIPLAGGTTCQTRSLSTIDLASPDFDPITGGTLKGTFAISDLSGCGILNGIVSPLTAGGGNAISITLTPAAPATT